MKCSVQACSNSPPGRFDHQRYREKLRVTLREEGQRWLRRKSAQHSMRKRLTTRHNQQGQRTSLAPCRSSLTAIIAASRQAACQYGRGSTGHVHFCGSYNRPLLLYCCFRLRQFNTGLHGDGGRSLLLQEIPPTFWAFSALLPFSLVDRPSPSAAFCRLVFGGHRSHHPGLV